MEDKRNTEEIKLVDIPEETIKQLEEIDVYAPVVYSFGQRNEAQQQCNKYGIVVNRLITQPESALAPEPIQKLLREWYDKINKLEAPYLCVRGAIIYFGYDDKNYRFKAGALNTDDGRLEYFASAILTDLRDIGCNYGHYEGFLD